MIGAVDIGDANLDFADARREAVQRGAQAGVDKGDHARGGRDTAVNKLDSHGGPP